MKIWLVKVSNFEERGNIHRAKLEDQWTVYFSPQNDRKTQLHCSVRGRGVWWEASNGFLNKVLKENNVTNLSTRRMKHSTCQLVHVQKREYSAFNVGQWVLIFNPIFRSTFATKIVQFVNCDFKEVSPVNSDSRLKSFRNEERVQKSACNSLSSHDESCFEKPWQTQGKRHTVRKWRKLVDRRQHLSHFKERIEKKDEQRGSDL